MLCQSWTDPHYDANAPAYYYARVSEVPTPRCRSCCASARACASDSPQRMQ
ncbi:MAG: DUF3604 domain-containing protein [Gammaproteobacteria bacterium]|nr:DUF3604 domain-containing protein [Gammaproteobacteria bacterium]